MSAQHTQQNRQARVRSSPRIRVTRLCRPCLAVAILAMLPVSGTARSQPHAFRVLSESTPPADVSPDIHQVLLGDPDVAFGELTRRLCGPMARESNVVNSVSGRAESHAGQTALAVADLAMELGTRDIPLCGQSVEALLDKEIAQPGYQRAERDISNDLERIVERETIAAPPGPSRALAEWMVSPSRRQVRRHLIDLDLSWYGQLVALRLHLSLRGGDGQVGRLYAALADAVDAQLSYLAVNRKAPLMNYVTERGVHTLAFLLVTAGTLHEHRDIDRSGVGVRAIDAARDLFANLVPHAVAPTTAAAHESALLRAHLVQLAVCGGDGLASSGASTAETVTNELAQLAAADMKSASVAENAAWSYHLRRGLAALQAHGRTPQRLPTPMACVSI